MTLKTDDRGEIYALPTFDVGDRVALNYESRADGDVIHIVGATKSNLRFPSLSVVCAPLLAYKQHQCWQATAAPTCLWCVAGVVYSG